MTNWCLLILVLMQWGFSTSELMQAKTDHYLAFGYSAVSAGQVSLDSLESSKKYVIVTLPGESEVIISNQSQLRLLPDLQFFVEPGVQIVVEGALRTDRSSFLLLPPEQQFQTESRLHSWQGFRVSPSGNLELKGGTLSGANSFLTSETGTWKLNCVDLASPSDCPLQIAGNCIPLDAMECVTKSNEDVVTTSPPLIVANQKATEPKAKKQTNLWAISSFGSLSLLAIVALGSAWFYHSQAEESRTQRDRVVSRSENERVRLLPHESRYQEMRGARNRSLWLGGIAASAALGVGISMSLSF